jgi:hypothetical protein
MRTLIVGILLARGFLHHWDFERAGLTPIGYASS